jgi:hypothetical protein
MLDPLSVGLNSAAGFKAGLERRVRTIILKIDRSIRAVCCLARSPSPSFCFPRPHIAADRGGVVLVRGHAPMGARFVSDGDVSALDATCHGVALAGQPRNILRTKAVDQAGHKGLGSHLSFHLVC